MTGQSGSTCAAPDPHPFVIAANELVRLTVVANELEAEMIRGLLATEGIESMQRKTDFAAAVWQVSPAGGPREILVYAGDLETARELIAAAQ